MTPQIWKNNRFIPNIWKKPYAHIGENDPLILSPSEWASGEWANHSGQLALQLEVDSVMDEVRAVLHKFEMVCVNFPVFSDGTAFSQARLIRDKFSFDGDIRACGRYLIDQMPLLRRCGVSSFEVASPAVKAGLERGLWPALPCHYQFALDGKESVAVSRTRPWLSRPSGVNQIETRTAA